MVELEIKYYDVTNGIVDIYQRMKEQKKQNELIYQLFLLLMSIGKNVCQSEKNLDSMDVTALKDTLYEIDSCECLLKLLLHSGHITKEQADHVLIDSEALIHLLKDKILIAERL